MLKVLITFSHFIFFHSCLFSQADTSFFWKKIAKEKYSIRFPDSWTFDSSKSYGAEFLLFSARESESDQFRDNINLIKVAIDNAIMNDGFNIEGYSEEFIRQLKSSVSDPDSIQFNKVDLATNSYYRVGLTGKQGEIRLRFEQRYYFTSNFCYILTSTLESNKQSEFVTIVKNILNSFQLL